MMALEHGSRVYVSVKLLIVAILSSSAWTLPDPSTTATVIGGDRVTEGDSIMLTCVVRNVSGERARSFRMEWRRDGVVLTRGNRVISPDRRYSVTLIDGVADRRDFVLHIDRVNRSDAGRYVCWVAVRDWYPSMPVKRSISSVNLIVRYFPLQPLCYHDGLSNVFKVGTRVQMVCSVDKGEPTVRTRWKGPNGIVLFGNETQSEGLIKNVLSFQASFSHDEMEFTCKVTSDGFPDQSSICSIGPIQVIESENIQDETYSSSSYRESSMDIQEAFPEPAISPTTTRSHSITFDNNNAHDVIYKTEYPLTPKIGSSGDGIQIISKPTNSMLAFCISFFVVLVAISSAINVILYYKLRKTKETSNSDDNNRIISAITSGVNNEEYMDMQCQRRNQPEGQLYSSIRRDTLNNEDVLLHYDLPNVSVRGASAPSHRNNECDTLGIYESMEGRPITPPRTKRNNRLKVIQEHTV